MKRFYFVFFLVVMQSWGQNMCLQKEILLETDRQFADLSEKNGLHVSFLEFIDKHCILLPQYGHPINGKEYFNKITNTTKNKSQIVKIGWKPIYADISESNDWGYTIGRYPVQVPDSTKHEDLKYNYYGSVWKRQANGIWKVILHVGLLKTENENQDNQPFYQSNEYSDREKEIMQVDRDFSNLSSEKGYFESFYQNIADDGVALSGAGRPPTNKEQFRQLVEHYRKNKPPDFKLVWEPISADMSSSGEIGFTHGRYQSISIDKDGKQNVGYGYYISLWKKQADGNWRFVFDGGNQSPVIKIGKN